ncbi:plasma membrane fusion protein prm1 [Coemansia biformis]|uniref:Plasma membrane fusion protein PRM1 n=1 Tax=Coemansia biformis TaxID=1286918 RepID=A0A9W7YHJ5_9FUNG|nr:plasma membrane fusion protein prm1 [Coemansia biformis]
MARELATFQQVVINDKILAPVRGDSVALANSINGDIGGVENNINGKVFDPVHSGMASLNDTLNNFVGTYISGIRSVFGGTPLQQPIEGLVNCTLTKNIQAIQKVLGYVNDFASGINLPRVSEDIIYGPVARLVGPLDATANHFREYAIGYYLPNADELDPNSFPEVNVDDILESYENKSESDSVSDSLSESESVSESESESSVSSHAPQQRKRQQAGQEATFGILQFPGQQSLSALPAESPEPSHPAPQAPSQAQPAAPAQGTTHVDAQSSKVAPTQSRHESSSDSSFELGGLDDDKSEGSSSFSFEPVPTEDLNRQDIIDAQEFGGYTGGILGKLCDSYVSDLKGDIPLMITLMSVWVVIIIMGTVNVFKDLRRVKKMNLKQ